MDLCCLVFLERIGSVVPGKVGWVGIANHIGHARTTTKGMAVNQCHIGRDGDGLKEITTRECAFTDGGQAIGKIHCGQCRTIRVSTD